MKRDGIELRPAVPPKSKFTFARKSRIGRPKAPEEPEDFNDYFDENQNSRLLIIVAAVSVIFNIIFVGYIIYQSVSSNETLEERCNLRKLINQNYIKIYNTDVIKDLNSLDNEDCDSPLEKSREYIQHKIELLGIDNRNAQDIIDGNASMSQQLSDRKYELSDLILLTQYLDKMIDGPKQCMPSKCEILENKLNDQSTILCTFNYKIKYGIDRK